MGKNKSDIKTIAKSTGIYFVGNVLSKVMVFFLVPIYTKFVDASSMGFYESATAIVQFIQNLLFVDIGATILRFMYDRANDKKKAVCTGIAIFSICLALYAVLGTFLGIFVKIEYIWYLVGYGAVGIANSVSSYICRGNGHNVYYAASGIVATIVSVSLNILLLVVAKMDYSAMYIALIASNFVQLVMLEIKNKNAKSFSNKNFDKLLFKDMWRYALPLSINNVAFWGLTSINKVLITVLVGEAANGYLAIANKFTSVVYLFSTCFQLAWQEMAFSKENALDESSGKYYGTALDLLLKILLIGLCAILPCIKLLLTAFPNFIDSQYSDAISLIAIAMAGSIMSVTSSFLGSIYGGIKKTNILLISTVVGAVVNVALVVGLTYANLGAQSANIGFLVGFSVNVLIRTLLLKKYINMKTNYVYFLVAALVYAGIAVIFTLCAWYYSLIVLVAVIAFACIVFKKELKLIIAKLFKKKAKDESNKMDTDTDGGCVNLEENTLDLPNETTNEKDDNVEVSNIDDEINNSSADFGEDKNIDKINENIIDDLETNIANGKSDEQK